MIRSALYSLCWLAVSLSFANAATPERQFIVTSADTLLASPLRQLPAQHVTDGHGTALRLLELSEAQMLALSEHIHEHEHRCGGYFAFSTREEAEDFLNREKIRHSVLAAAPRRTYTIDNRATVSPWLTQVSEPNIRSTISEFSSFQNRHYASPHGLAAAQWLHEQWQTLAQGRDDVTTVLYDQCSNCSTQPSVILTVQGWECPSEVVVIGGHLDSIRIGNHGNPQQYAPGADDNASGIASITEVMRIALASGWKPRRTVKFMGYAAEEVGLRGSRAIAERHAADEVNVIGVLQLDMTNYSQDVSHAINFIADGTHTDLALRQFSYTLFDTYLAPLNLSRRITTCGYACSDHASWAEAGFPAVMASEPGSPLRDFYQGLHTATDTLAHLGGTADVSVPLAQFALAFLGEMAKTHTGDGPPPLHIDDFEHPPSCF